MRKLSKDMHLMQVVCYVYGGRDETHQGAAAAPGGSRVKTSRHP